MKRLIALIVFGMVSAGGEAGDANLAWPQFRGPGGSGVAEEQNPPVKVGPETNVKWKTTVPSGFSSPIVVADKLILTGFDSGKLYTIAYSRADGKEHWRAEAPTKTIEGYHKTEGSPAASTPTTDGDKIISYFGSCGLFCYDLSGKELWKHETPTAVTIADFGTGVSPILADGVVVLLRDVTNDPKIIALDAATGAVKWEKKRQSFSGFGSPLIWNTPAGKQVVAPGSGRLIAYDLTTGDEKWSISGMPAACCTTPVAADGVLFFAGWSPGDPSDKDFKLPSFDQLLKMAGAESEGVLTKKAAEKTFLKNFFDNNDANKDGKITREEWDANLKMMSASRNSAFAVKSGGAGDVSDSHVLWKKTKALPYVPSAIVYQGKYVMVKDGGIVTAYDAKTGDEIHQGRLAAPGSYYASPVAANGRVYFTSLSDGVVTVVKFDSAKPEVVAKNPPLGERVAATPAIADNTLYIRTATKLYAFAEK